MRTSALVGAGALVVGLAALAAGLYYDQAHLVQWTHFAQSSNLTKGPTEVETARVFNLLGSIAAGFGAVIALGSTLLGAFAGRAGHWLLRLTSVLLLVVLLLIAVAVAASSFTGDAPVAIIDTPWWLLTAEWSAVALAVTGGAVATAQLWRFAPDTVDPTP
jgi:hypothetical protein